MRPRRRLRHFLLTASRGTVFLALLGFLAASIGFPAPAPSPERERQSSGDRPTACRGRACGCTGDSDHCCCCSQERAGRAAPPPPETERPARSHACCQQERQERTDATSCPLCAIRALLFPSSVTTAECPAGGACPFCPKEAEPAAAEGPSGDSVIRWVHGLQARHCRGLDTLWYALAAALPLPPPLRWEGDGRPAGWLTPSPFDARSVSRCPPAPPPRG